MRVNRVRMTNGWNEEGEKERKGMKGRLGSTRQVGWKVGSGRAVYQEGGYN